MFITFFDPSSIIIPATIYTLAPRHNGFRSGLSDEGEPTICTHTDMLTNTANRVIINFVVAFRPNLTLFRKKTMLILMYVSRCKRNIKHGVRTKRN